MNTLPSLNHWLKEQGHETLTIANSTIIIVFGKIKTIEIRQINSTIQLSTTTHLKELNLEHPNFHQELIKALQNPKKHITTPTI